MTDNYRTPHPRKTLVLLQDHIIVLELIERTVHGPWTHFQSVANKRTLVRWLNLYAGKWLMEDEKKLINDSVTICWWDKNPELLAVSYQFLCDLVTTVLYARGMDVWEIILATPIEGD